MLEAMTDHAPYRNEPNTLCTTFVDFRPELREQMFLKVYNFLFHSETDHACASGSVSLPHHLSNLDEITIVEVRDFFTGQSADYISREILRNLTEPSVANPANTPEVAEVDDRTMRLAVGNLAESFMATCEDLTVAANAEFSIPAKLSIDY